MWLADATMTGKTTTVVICAVLLAALLVVTHGSNIHQHATPWTVLSKLCWKNATVRPPLLLVAIVAGWGWVVSICDRAGLDLERVPGGPTQSPSASYHAALILLAVILAAHLAHFLASESSGLTWRPWLCCNLALHLALLALGVMPCDAFFGRSRLSLLRATLESIIAPLSPVTFWHVIVADYMTSLAKAFSDLQLSACISYRIFSISTSTTYVRSTDLWQARLLYLHPATRRIFSLGSQTHRITGTVYPRHTLTEL